jgi:hypothetical protein
MGNVGAECREPFHAVFDRTAFPVTDLFELISVLPGGPATEFRASEVVGPAIDLGSTDDEYQDGSSESVSVPVDGFITGDER